MLYDPIRVCGCRDQRIEYQETGPRPAHERCEAQAVRRGFGLEIRSLCALHGTLIIRTRPVPTALDRFHELERIDRYLNADGQTRLHHSGCGCGDGTVPDPGARPGRDRAGEAPGQTTRPAASVHQY